MAPQKDDLEGMKPVFLLDSLGCDTGRDSWCYNSSDGKLRENIRQTVDFYNDLMESFEKVGATGSQKEKEAQSKDFVGSTAQAIPLETGEPSPP